MKRILTALALLFTASAFAGGSNPGFTYGQVPTPAQWNSYFSSKLDFTPGPANSMTYWDGAGNFLNAAISGDCSSIANVFTCTKTNGQTYTSLFASPPQIGTVTPGTGAFTTLAATSYSLNGKLVGSATVPTIASGFGTSPSVLASNGTAAFTINVGTGGVATSGVVTMPAATTGWACTVMPNGAPQAAAEMFSAPTSTTSITITNYTASTAVALAWPASAVISVQCKGY